MEESTKYVFFNTKVPYGMFKVVSDGQLMLVESLLDGKQYITRYYHVREATPGEITDVVVRKLNGFY